MLAVALNLSSLASLAVIDGLVPLAAVDWVKLIIFAVVAIIWLINQLSNVIGNKAQPKKPPQVPPGRPNQANPQAGQRGLLDEVEQFLKEARKNVEQAQQTRTKPQPPAPPPRVKQPKQPKKPKPAPPPPRRTLATEPALDDVERGSSVADHVKRHIDTSRFDSGRFDQRAGNLSRLQQTVDQDIGAHVKSVFDHEIGTLGGGSTLGDAPKAVVAPTPADQLVAMLRDPQGIRNAILMQEILRPPVERW